MFSFGLSLGKPLYVPEGGFKVLEPVNMSMEITDTQSVFLNASNTDSYSIPNLPAWCSLNSSTGEITVTPDGTEYGQEKFDVILTNADGSTTITDGLTISIFREQSTISGKLTTEVSPITDEGSAVTTITTSTAPLLYDVQNNYWKILLLYFSSYGNNQQAKIINMTTKAEDFNEQGWEEGNPVNLMSSLVAYNGHTYMRAYDLMWKYDTNTQVLARYNNHPDIDGLYYNLKLGTNGKVVTSGNKPDGTLSSVEIDTTNDTYIEYTDITVGDADGAGHNCVADDTYLYQTTTGNEGTNFRLYAVEKATGTPTLLINSSTWVNLSQYQYGCSVYISVDSSGYTAGSYWLYNGVMTPVDSFTEEDCPWDNQGAGFDDHTGSPIDYPIIDRQGAVPPTGSNTGSIWYRDLATDPWVSADINSISTYATGLTDIITVSDKVVSVASQYLGYSVLDTNLNIAQQYQLVNNSVSNYCNLEMNGKLYMSGYPSGTLLEYDPSIPWDNTTSAYNPETSTGGSNPSFIGYTRDGIGTGGTGGGQHKNFALVDDGNNKLWCAGEWERDGTGAGITVVDLSNNYLSYGIRDSINMSEYIPMDGCATDNYVVILCKGYSVPTEVKIIVIDKITYTVTYYSLPVGPESPASIIHNKLDEVVVRAGTSSDVVTLTSIDVSNGTVTYNKEILGTYSGEGAIHKYSDGNHYMSIGDNNCLVDLDNGLVEDVNNIGIDGKRTELDGIQYIIANQTTYKNTDCFIPPSFSLVPAGTELITSISIWEAGTTHITFVDNLDGTYTFIDDGSKTGYWSIDVGMLRVPINAVDWEYSFNLVSGYGRCQSVRVGGVDTNLARIFDIGNNILVGTELNPISDVARLQMYSTSTPGEFTLTVYSLNERDS